MLENSLTRENTLLTRGLILLGLLLLGAAIVFTLLPSDRQAIEGNWGFGGWLGAFFIAVPGIAFLSVGSLLTLRRPENSIGWLCLTIGLLWLMLGTTNAIANWAVMRGQLGVAAWFGLLGNLWPLPVGLMGTHLLLRLPDGLLLSPRWRWYSRFCTVVIILTTLLTIIQPQRLVPDLPGTENPLWIESLQTLQPLQGLLEISMLGAIVSLVLRYRRAGGVEQHQLRWIAFGGVFLVMWFVVIAVLLVTVVSPTSTLGRLLEDMDFVGFSALPVAIGIAVLRYRLYDIDILISRTLVYVPLTAILAGIFAIAQELTSRLLARIWGEDLIASTIVPTLIVIAVFEPLKSRLGRLVDKYFKDVPDPARAVKVFRDKVQSRVLRVNPETITGELLEEAVLGFGAASGAVFLNGATPEHPIHATRGWDGIAKLTVPLRSGETSPALGSLTLGPQRTGGEYTPRHRELLQEMAGVVATAIEQDRQPA